MSGLVGISALMSSTSGEDSVPLLANERTSSDYLEEPIGIGSTVQTLEDRRRARTSLSNTTAMGVVTIWQDIKSYRRVYALTAVASFGGMLFGWDTGLIGGVRHT